MPFIPSRVIQFSHSLYNSASVSIENVISEIFLFPFCFSSFSFIVYLFNLNKIMHRIIFCKVYCVTIWLLFSLIIRLQRNQPSKNMVSDLTGFAFTFSFLSLVTQFEAYYRSIYLVRDLFILESSVLLNSYPIRITLRIKEHGEWYFVFCLFFCFS